MISDLSEGPESTPPRLLFPIVNAIIHSHDEPIWEATIPVFAKWIKSHVDVISRDKDWSVESIMDGKCPVELEVEKDNGLTIVIFVEGWEYANLRTMINIGE